MLGWTLQDSSNGDPEADDTPAKFRHRTPPVLRSLLMVYDETDVHNLYPKIHLYEAFKREHLAFVYFMRRFPGYQFCWFAEYDIRSAFLTSSNLWVRIYMSVWA